MMSADKPVIMIVAGGQWQVPLIHRAHAFGAFIVNTNLYHDSPGFEFADVGVVANVLDRDANLCVARKYKPDAILTDQSDIAVPTVAWLCEQLGLRGIGVDVARRFTNKSLMRDACRQCQMPRPEYRECGTVSELAEFRRALGRPVVVKPPANQSSRGVTYVDAIGDLDVAFHEALRFSDSGFVLAEEFIGGCELTVEGIKLPDRHHTLAISVKRHFNHNPMVADQLLYKSLHSDFDAERLTRQHDTMIHAFGLPFGLTHSEYKYFNGEFYLVETAARGGGTRVASHIVPIVSGIDCYDLLIRMALGHDVGPLEPKEVKHTAVLEFFEFPAGTITRIHGVEAAKEVDSILDVCLNFAPGDALSVSRDDRSRHMHVIAAGETVQQVEQAVATCRECISVEYK